MTIENSKVDMYDNPLVSVIIPIFNTGKYLPRCLDSVVNQTYRNFEVVVVNDGSTDNSAEICDKYAAKDKRIAVIHKSNEGVSSARNTALDYIHGSYLTFLDSDDFLHINFIDTLYKLSLQLNADIVQCQYLKGHSSVFPTFRHNKSIKTYNKYSIFLKDKAKIGLTAKLYKTELWQNIRMPVGRAFEDDATTWKIYYLSNRIALTSLPYYYYFNNTSSTMATALQNFKFHDYLEAYVERIRFFKGNNEKELLVATYNHFCKSLMLNYLVRKSNDNNIFLLNRFLVLFKKSVLYVLSSSLVSVKLRFLYLLFYFCPKICRFVFHNIIRSK